VCPRPVDPGAGRRVGGCAFRLGRLAESRRSRGWYGPSCARFGFVLDLELFHVLFLAIEL
jgi:hypothetical protein